MSLKLPYYILKESGWEEPIESVYYYDTQLGRYTTNTEYAYPFAYSVLEYYFPISPLAVFNLPYQASVKLRIVVNNINYASALLRIHTANSIKAKLRIQIENKAQAKLKIQTTGPAQAKLYMMTLRASPRPQARLRIFADHSNYASALLRIETKRFEPAQAKLRIRTRTYNRKISMPEYYAFYNISTHGFLP